MVKKAQWSAGKPAASVADGTLTAAVPLLDGGKLAATLTFTITADRAATLIATVEPGPTLTGFQAWSNV